MDSIELAEAVLKRHGIEYSRHVLPETGMQQLFCLDPEGNGIELGRFDDTRRFFAEHGDAPEP